MNVRRRVLLCALVAVAIVVGFAFRAWWVDQRSGLYARVATQLKRSLSSESRFAGVTVRRERQDVVVLAPDTLEASDRAALQGIVAAQGRPLDIHVRYMPALDPSRTDKP